MSHMNSDCVFASSTMSNSTKSSILRPPVRREPLQDLQMLPALNSDEDTTTTTLSMAAMAKRRVSFSGRNSVKEYVPCAEPIRVMNTPAYEETYAHLSSDSSCMANSTGQTDENMSQTCAFNKVTLNLPGEPLARITNQSSDMSLCVTQYQSRRSTSRMELENVDPIAVKSNFNCPEIGNKDESSFNDDSDMCMTEPILYMSREFSERVVDNARVSSSDQVNNDEDDDQMSFTRAFSSTNVENTNPDMSFTKTFGVPANPSLSETSSNMSFTKAFQVNDTNASAGNSSMSFTKAIIAGPTEGVTTSESSNNMAARYSLPSREKENVCYSTKSRQSLPASVVAAADKNRTKCLSRSMTIDESVNQRALNVTTATTMTNTVSDEEMRKLLQEVDLEETDDSEKIKSYRLSDVSFLIRENLVTKKQPRRSIRRNSNSPIDLSVYHTQMVQDIEEEELVEEVEKEEEECNDNVVTSSVPETQVTTCIETPIDCSSAKVDVNDDENSETFQMDLSSQFETDVGQPVKVCDEVDCVGTIEVVEPIDENKSNHDLSSMAMEVVDDKCELSRNSSSVCPDGADHVSDDAETSRSGINQEIVDTVERSVVVESAKIDCSNKMTNDGSNKDCESLYLNLNSECEMTENGEASQLKDSNQHDSSHFVDNVSNDIEKQPTYSSSCPSEDTPPTAISNGLQSSSGNLTSSPVEEQNAGSKCATETKDETRQQGFKGSKNGKRKSDSLDLSREEGDIVESPSKLACIERESCGSSEMIAPALVKMQRCAPNPVPVRKSNNTPRRSSSTDGGGDTSKGHDETEADMSMFAVNVTMNSSSVYQSDNSLNVSPNSSIAQTQCKPCYVLNELSETKHCYSFYSGALMVILEKTHKGELLNAEMVIGKDCKKYEVLFATKTSELIGDKLAKCKNVSEVLQVISEINLHVNDEETIYKDFVYLSRFSSMELTGERLTYDAVSGKNRIWFRVSMDVKVIWENISDEAITFNSYIGAVKESDVKHLYRCCVMSPRRLRDFVKSLEDLVKRPAN